MKPSLPITDDKRQVTKANLQTSLARPRIEAKNGENKILQVLNGQDSKRPLAFDDVALKRETTTTAVSANRQTPSILPQEATTASRAVDPAAMQAQRAPRGANDNVWLYRQPPHHYSVQLLSAESETDAQRYLQRKKLGGQAAYFHGRIEGKDWYYVLYGSFATREEAEAAGQQITTSVWVRRFGVLQKKRCIGAADLPPQQSLEVKALCSIPG